MDEGDIGSETNGKLEDDVDALFKLPLAEFIGICSNRSVFRRSRCFQ